MCSPWLVRYRAGILTATIIIMINLPGEHRPFRCGPSYSFLERKPHRCSTSVTNTRLLVKTCQWVVANQLHNTAQQCKFYKCLDHVQLSTSILCNNDNTSGLQEKKQTVDFLIFFNLLLRSCFFPLPVFFESSYFQPLLMLEPHLFVSLKLSKWTHKGVN